MKNRSLLFIAMFAAIGLLVFLLIRHPSESSVGKIRIAEGTQPIAAPVYVAFAKGYFKEEGIDVELVSFPTGKLCLDALIGGSADFATSAETPLMHAAFSNQPIKIVATIHRSTKNTFCVADKRKGILTPYDLKGKTVAVPIGTNAEYAFAKFLCDNKIDPKQVTFINLSPPEMIGALTKGNVVDAVVAWQPHIGRCQAALKQDTTVFSFSDSYEETYNLVTNEVLVKEKPEIVVKVLKALLRALDFMKANPDESIDIVAKRIGMDNAELTRLWRTNNTYNFGLDLKPSLIDLLQEEAKWAIDKKQHQGPVPDMREIISTVPLKEVSRGSVKINE